MMNDVISYNAVEISYDLVYYNVLYIFYKSNLLKIELFHFHEKTANSRYVCIFGCY